MSRAWGRVFSFVRTHAGQRAAVSTGAAVGAAGLGLATFPVGSLKTRSVLMDSNVAGLEDRVRQLEAQLALFGRGDEEVRAIAIIKKLAKQHGLDVEGGIIRRTSSRFCLGVEHGDYNGTELFGVGTDRFIWIGYKPNNLGRVRIYSHNFPEDGLVEFTPGQVPPARSPQIGDTWARFPYGVDHVLRSNNYPTSQGFDAVVVGNIPGGGMSRSASLIINLLLTAMEVNGTPMPEGDFKGVTMSHAVETEYVGTPCGKLDQIMIYYAKEGMGTRYDPHTEKVSYVPLGLDANEFRIAALDTGTVRHGLEKSTYAIRVKECQELVKLMKASGFKVDSFADVKDEAVFQQIRAKFEKTHPGHVRRLEYIFYAQKRFEAMVDAWEKGDIEEVGRIFRQDGIGLRDAYSISGPELETMVDVARTVPGVLGERMLGGGDKGAAGAILKVNAEPQLRAAVNTGFKRSHPDYADKCAVHVVKVCQGVERLAGLL
eukprot:TRINITY_DN26141_c0_g1_i1.p1 TRINITY_DN26141_c0_g1~~TRINITY_DN26141_c0_g1_i1.p1  ORF type:complete len:486 (+),score=117.51 TRINITY_DN26141_c0_g1_i1:47-1504(+)